MKTLSAFPGIAFERLGPTLDEQTKALRARQLSIFMRDEVYGQVYEGDFGLQYIDTGPLPGTQSDIDLRLQEINEYDKSHLGGAYQECIVAYERDARGLVSEDGLAVLGLVIVSKGDGLCTPDQHQATYIDEIDVARRMYGKKLAPALLSLATSSHAEDPVIGLAVYQHNARARRFYDKLGFGVVEDIDPMDSEIYGGKWIIMEAAPAEFHTKLNAMLPTQASSS